MARARTAAISGSSVSARAASTRCTVPDAARLALTTQARSVMPARCRSSPSFARPCASRPAPLLASTSSRDIWLATPGSMRLTVRRGRSPAGVSARCAAGSVVVNSISCPCAASSTATAAAMVVLPMPRFHGHHKAPACGLDAVNQGLQGRKVGVAAAVSPLASSGISQLAARCRFPLSARARPVRAGSASEFARGRAMRISRMCAPSDSPSTAAAWRGRCFSSPVSGPRQEASPHVSGSPLRAPGSSRMRIVWPLGAVSKMIRSCAPVTAVPVNRAVNSSKAAISVVRAPDLAPRSP